MEDVVYNKLLSSIIDNLRYVGRTFVVEENEVHVELVYGLKCKIIVKQNGIDIKSELVPYNPLTGLLKMNLENSLKYTSIFFFILVIVVHLLNKFIDGVNILRPPFFFILFVVCIHTITWFCYYFIVFYVFKSQVENWILQIKEKEK